jgi:hypothetical protein
MALTLEQKAELLAKTRRHMPLWKARQRWRPMLVCDNGRVVRDVDVYVSPIDHNILKQSVVHMIGTVIQVRKE